MRANRSDADRARRKRARALLFARVLGGIGRTMITAGVLILLFVAYQLWGTGIRTAQAQTRLDEELAELLERAESALVSAPTTTATTVPDPATPTSRLPATTVATLPPDLAPQRGEPAGRIVIEAIGVDYTFVEGVGVNDLKQGPGHYPQTPLPGQAGNSAIAGHRTTYGAPFANVDQLRIGDEIVVTTVQGTFTYEVRREPLIVRPTQVEVLENGFWDEEGEEPGNWLTLTACHPKYSARERIIIAAELVGEPAPTTAPSEPVEEDAPIEFEEATLDGVRAEAWPAVTWAAICAFIWLLAWLLGKKWRRLKWPSYAVLVVPFMVGLFFFFENFSRLLPANY